MNLTKKYTNKMKESTVTVRSLTLGWAGAASGELLDVKKRFVGTTFSDKKTRKW